MIVRILTEGQFRIEQSALAELNELDDAVLTACKTEDRPVFEAALTRLIDRVREVGEPLGLEELLPSDFVLPMADATMEEVAELLTDEGLIPD